MTQLFMSAALLQGVLMILDEAFHRRRGLGTWERLGHPLDTLGYLLCGGLLMPGPFTPLRFNLYVGAAVFSTLLITKDEWVHARECGPVEHWLHAMLFILHPVLLIALGSLWSRESVDPQLLWGVRFYFGSILAFFFYQTLYWNHYREPNRTHQ